MDDLISRAAARKVVELMIVPPIVWIGAAHEIDDIPAVDAVPVVRCKDCKHGKHIFDSFGRPYVECYNPYIQSIWYRDLTDYCSDGKKEEDGGEKDE